MNKIYRSKMDTWIAILLAGLPIPLMFVAWKLVHEAIPGRWFMAAIIVLMGVCLPVSLLAFTTYTITTDSLLIRSGPLKWKIPLRDITAIEPTRNPLSSPALSLDRLRIDYGRGNSVMISPVHQEDFLRELRAHRVSTG